MCHRAAARRAVRPPSTDPIVQTIPSDHVPPRAGEGCLPRKASAAPIAALALGWLLGLYTSPALAQTPRASQRILVVSQVAGPDGASIVARIGSLTFGATGLATDRVSAAVPNASAIAQVALLDFGNTLTQSQLIAQATAHLAPQAPALAASLGAALQARGLGQATFTLDQQVSVAGVTAPRRLVWTLSVDRAGRASFAEPRVFDAQPHILHVQYVPLRVAAGLPGGWAYPDAGRLRWQRLNLQMQPIGPVGTLDTGGAYDAPDTLDGLPIDPEAGLRCLVDRRSRNDCPQGLTDIVTLIDEQGSASALLDYGLRLAPVYDAVPAANGAFDQVARMSLQVDRREVSYAGCSAEMPFRNTGHYGYTLEASNDRYTVAADGRFARIDRTQAITLSPTIGYDWTRLLRPVALSALTPLILDPQDPARPLLTAASVDNLIYLAPITTSGQSEQVVLSFTSPPYESGRIQVEVRCSIEGNWTIRSVIAPWARCLAGGCNSTYLVYEATFTAGQPALAPRRFTAQTYRGHAWEPQQAEYDGGTTITLWHGDYFCGERLGARFSFSGQYLGLTEASAC
jgi:hypothetical protein